MTEQQHTILVVDDTPENIDLLANALRDHYKVKAAINGEIALKLAEKEQPDLILLDVMMPGISGFEVCERLKADPLTRHIPVIFVTAMMATEDELHGLELGAVDYITKPINPSLVKARVRTHLALHDQSLELEIKIRERTQELETTRLQIIQRLGRAAEYKDNETGMHVIRMSKYSYYLALAAGLTENDARLLMNAAPMHDIGKIGIPDHILQKKGRLTDEEMAVMRTHCEIGAMIIGDDNSELLKLAKVVAMTHHEKWDGSGYPNGLKGKAIPIEGRIVAIADVFDALTSERPYKQAWPIEKAIEYLEEQAGSHFDPELVPLFIECLPDILMAKKTYADNVELKD